MHRVGCAQAGAAPALADQAEGVIGNIAWRYRFAPSLGAQQQFGGNGSGIVGQFLSVFTTDGSQRVREGADAGDNFLNQQFSCLWTHMWVWLRGEVMGCVQAKSPFPEQEGALRSTANRAAQSGGRLPVKVEIQEASESSVGAKAGAKKTRTSLTSI